MAAKSKHILLLTGAPGVGKTTVIRRVAERLSDWRLAGFYTDEIRVHGKRQGFRLATFDGQKIVMAHVDFPKTFQIGQYGVDVSALDSIVESALTLDESMDVYVIDEIGKMECLSARFVAVMLRLLDACKPVVATIAQSGTGFIAEVKRRQDIRLWEVTGGNRGELPETIIRWLGSPS